MIDTNSGWSIVGHSLLIVIWVLYIIIGYKLFEVIYDIKNVWVLRILSLISSIVVSTAICLAFRTLFQLLYYIVTLYL